jgi:UDPglucose 6-dehydrogenase
MQIAIFGAGYVGLVQAAVMADSGHDVVCVDIDRERVRLLTAGHVPFFEPGLDKLIVANVEARRLSFTTDAAAALVDAEVVFIAVGTPSGEDGSADLRHVLAVAETIGREVQREIVVVTKSTVPVGTGDKVEQRFKDVLRQRGRGDIVVHIASNPEFLKEGSAVADFSRPDRIIIGTTSEVAEQKLRDIYAPFNRNHERILVMDVRSAELTKYAANSFLATKISFMNEIADLADRLGADIEHVRQGIGLDARIGHHFIYAGAGYGGSCFPKDVRALIRTADESGVDAGILRAVEARNESQKRLLAHKIREHFGDLRGKVFALWGLSFKPNTDDMREAPSVVLIDELTAAGATVRAYDPKAMEEARKRFPDKLVLCRNQYEALEGADALVLVTEWTNFRAPDFAAVAAALSAKVIFDGRNIYNPAMLARYGLRVFGIGRRSGPEQSTTPALKLVANAKRT